MPDDLEPLRNVAILLQLQYQKSHQGWHCSPFYVAVRSGSPYCKSAQQSNKDQSSVCRHGLTIYNSVSTQRVDQTHWTRSKAPIHRPKTHTQTHIPVKNLYCMTIVWQPVPPAAKTTSHQHPIWDPQSPLHSWPCWAWTPVREPFLQHAAVARHGSEYHSDPGRWLPSSNTQSRKSVPLTHDYFWQAKAATVVVSQLHALEPRGTLFEVFTAWPLSLE